MKSRNEEKAPKYWLAINGSSCAACPIPAIDLGSSPVAEQLIGYPTQEEQLDAQRVFLEAPIDEVRRYMELELAPKIESGEVRYRKPANPEPPSSQTHWIIGGNNLPS